MERTKLRKPLALLLALALAASMFAATGATAYAADECEEVTVTISGGQWSASGTPFDVKILDTSLHDKNFTCSIRVGDSFEDLPLMTKVEVLEGTTLIGTINNVNSKYCAYDVDYSPCETMPSSLTFKIYYIGPSYGLTGASSLSGRGGVTFKVNGTEVTEVKYGETVTATAVALDGYTATLASDDVAIASDGTFTMPSKAVTVTANYAELATSGTADLDLEAGTSGVPSGTTIEQYYIKTTGDKTTTYNRIKVSWASQSIEVKVADAKKWDHASLAWVPDSENSGTASVAEGTNVTEFTFTNYSTKAFGIVPTFAADSSLPSGASNGATYDATSYSVNAIEVGSDDIALEKYFTDSNRTTVNESALPSVTITATNNVNASAFNNAQAMNEAAKFGTFTFTCTATN